MAVFQAAMRSHVDREADVMHGTTHLAQSPTAYLTGIKLKNRIIGADILNARTQGV
jgi:hypothetical protein